MTSIERQQQVVERILEDESLRGDLEDRAATALVSWAADRAGAIAADASRADELVDAEVLAIRNAARLAAAAGESEPEHVVALAEAELGKHAAASSPSVTQSGTLSDAEQPARAATLPPLFVPDLTMPGAPLKQRAHGAPKRREAEQPGSTAATAPKAGKTGAASHEPHTQAGAEAGATIADAAERIAGGAGSNRRTKRAAGKK